MTASSESTLSDEEYDGNKLNAILDEKDTKVKLLAMKRGAHGQPAQKNARAGPPDPMSIDKLLNTAPADCRKKKKKGKANPRRKGLKRMAQPKRSPGIPERQNKYDVVSALTNAQAGLTFEQLWHSDRNCTQKELDRIFGKAKLKVGVVEVNDHKVRAETTDEKKCLAAALVEIYGTEVYALFDIGATPKRSQQHLPYD